MRGIKHNIHPSTTCPQNMATEEYCFDIEIQDRDGFLEGSLGLDRTVSDI